MWALTDGMSVLVHGYLGVHGLFRLDGRRELCVMFTRFRGPVVGAAAVAVCKVVGAPRGVQCAVNETSVSPANRVRGRAPNARLGALDHGNQYVSLMRDAFGAVENQYRPDTVWGEKVGAIAAAYAVPSSVHSLTAGVALMQFTSACVNGSVVRLFGNADTPKITVWILAQYAQTRKTQATRIITRGAQVLDQMVFDRAMSEWRQLKDEIEGRSDGDESVPPMPTRQKHSLEASSPEALWAHLAPDKVGRTWSGEVLNLDEFYAFAQAMDLYGEKADCVNKHQPTWNKLVSEGIVSIELRSEGKSYGRDTSSPISCGGFAHLHVPAAIPFVRRTTGQHLTACAERMSVFTARTVQPHEDPSPHDRFDWGEVTPHRWVRFRADQLERLGLSDFVEKVRREDPSLVPAPATDAVYAPEDGGERTPCVRGVMCPLSDNSVLRMRLSGDCAEIRIANRAGVTWPSGKSYASLDKLVGRLVRFYKDRNRVIRLDDEAREFFDCEQLVTNVAAEVTTRTTRLE